MWELGGGGGEGEGMELGVGEGEGGRVLFSYTYEGDSLEAYEGFGELLTEDDFALLFALVAV